MPLKKKFALILILALVIHLLCTALYLKFFLAQDLTKNLIGLHKEFAGIFNGLSPDMTLRELGTLLNQKLHDQSFLNAIIFKGVIGTLRTSLLLLPILLIVVLFFIDREILKPLNRLNTVIDNFNRKNGYYGTRHSKNEILKLSNNFFIMSEQIELNKRQKDEFISCISHDLKTPLTSILGYTQRLIDPGIPDEVKRQKYYQTILTKANTIKTLVEELNIYVLGELQELSLQKTNLKGFLSEIAEEYHEELLTYEITLLLSIDLSEELYGFIDPNQIRRVFANIFSNTALHGGRNIEVTLNAFKKDDTLCIRIENNGKVPETLDFTKVFQLMYQADLARTNKNSEGSGLGLAIVKQIIEKHNGNIQAYRPATGGFGLEFYLPLASLL